MKMFTISITKLVNYRLQAGYLFNRGGFRLKSYLLGWKGQFSFFNLKPVMYQSKLLLFIIIKLVSKRQKILIVNHSQKSFSISKLVKLPRFQLAEGAWMGGLLTNCKDLQFNKKNQPYPHLPKLRSLPALVVLLNMTMDNWALKEANNLNIPVSAIIGSYGFAISGVLYPIVCENESPESILFYTTLVRTAVVSGLVKEKLRLFY